MGLKDCEIELDNPYNTYYAGQTVNGKVTFTFDSPKKVRGIVIKFAGEAETKWSQTETKTDQEGKQYESTTNLTGQEEYFQIQYYLLGGKNSNEIELEAKSHTYPFTCALPPTLPSSFEGEWGFVRYTIKVTLDRPWKFDQDLKMAFTVISPVDLNQNPRVKDPFKLELEKTFCCFCCASGPLSLIIHIPVTGFVSGQTIPLTIECDNASNVGVDSVKLTMRKLLAFHVMTPRRETKKKKEVISEISVGPVEGGNSQTWSQHIQIPPLPPSNLVNCGIIDVDYDIKVEAVVSGPHANLDGNIPIVVGTVPLASFQPPPPYTDNPPITDDPSMLPTQPVSPASPPNGTGGALGWNIAGADNPYPNIPPPTFAEATFKAPNISNKNDSEFTRFVGPADYAPRYPTYAFAPSAPPADL
ncbi:arrestin domain containing 4 [Culex quinquefasciatus]|uniref:Arrestin domain containing 4 n=1 Tax=Culex quinquefasciatus TaxID=7176 RepID=B0WMD4_CULQU|nr:arrestin domain-containing protein 17 [Culex quinquefasciatus]XP_038119565.1 arrestin domain-containing protein 17 [Culex quinquefasciatus]EDS30991.1 arrestin domain containing 4 [Culex quinquefasciatus]|eukprot:XP_001849868.1 arrestin domain containing 4 [Culex quinquefasciatus]